MRRPRSPPRTTFPVATADRTGSSPTSRRSADRSSGDESARAPGLARGSRPGSPTGREAAPRAALLAQARRVMLGSFGDGLHASAAKLVDRRAAVELGVG